MNTYLKKASLQGYRTIRNVEVEFAPALNIIIGKNGSGKTNFMSFLYNSLNLEYSGLTGFRSILEFNGKSQYSLTATRSLENLKPEDLIKKNLDDKVDISVRKVHDTFETKVEDQSQINEFLKPIGTFEIANFIRHGIDANNFNVTISSPLAFDIDISNLTSLNSAELFLNYSKTRGSSSFTSALFLNLLISVILEKDLQDKDLQKHFTEKVCTVFELICNTLNRYINKYLPIESVRLNPAFKVYTDDEKKLIKFQGLIFDFKFGGDWLPFSSLSDGTKRLFYLFAEIMIAPTYSSIRSTSIPSNRILLVEEPELGIHPHQFHEIMSFLKEVSLENQVIITTHSPQSLNIVTENDLQTIIISSYNQEEGSTFKKLTSDQISKAKIYMEDMYLSDYWVYSDLEE
ncbi:AAA family ATPase [Pedobacter sp. PWIIR3]